MTTNATDARFARRQYVDWLRGIAVLIMIMWHAVDSWHVREARTTPAFVWVTFLAGWAAPLFLFLAGLSLALAGEARLSRGASRDAAARALARRGWEVFALAHLFRLQSFLFNPNASWTAILKPDILNVLGVGLVVAAYLWQQATTARLRLLWFLLPTIVVALVVTPLAPSWWWPTLLHPRLEAYIRPVGNMGVFSLFPAVAFVFAGGFVGATLAGRTDAAKEFSFQRTAALIGVGLVTLGALVDARTSMAWIQPAAVISWRVGGTLLLLAFGWWLLRSSSLGARHPLMVLGRTSLFVYWVHIEIAYGVISFPLWKALSLPWALVAYGLLTTAMYGAALIWLRRPAGPLIPAHMRAGGRKPDFLDRRGSPQP